MVTLHLSNESYFKHIMWGYQRPMESLGQKEARKKRITRNEKRVGTRAVQSRKTVKDVDIAKQRHHPWKLETEIWG